MLTVIRGLPDSGKSELGKQIAEAGHDGHTEIFEADEFHMDSVELGGDPIYNYIPEQGKYARMWVHGLAAKNIRDGYNTVVTGTYLTMESLTPLVEMAKVFGVEFKLIECKSSFGKAIHGVPEEVINKMKRQWEEYDPKVLGV